MIDLNNRTSAEYDNECLVSISAGIDGSLWGLACEDNVSDYQIVKFHSVSNKWYKIPDARGATLSAFNEISVGVVNSFG